MDRQSRLQAGGLILACRPGRGFTLVEALAAGTILAIVSASAILPFSASLQQSRESARLEQATALGQAMVEEIMARPFFEPGSRTAAPGPDPGELSREMFDNIDDFHGYTENGIGPRNYRNEPITDEAVAGLWRTVSVEYVTFPDQAGDDADSYVHIRVNVFDGNATALRLDRIVARED